MGSLAPRGEAAGPILTAHPWWNTYIFFFLNFEDKANLLQRCYKWGHTFSFFSKTTVPWWNYKSRLGRVSTNRRPRDLDDLLDHLAQKKNYGRYIVNITCFNVSKNQGTKALEIEGKQVVHGPWRSAWQLQLVWHWQFSADLYKKLTVAY